MNRSLLDRLGAKNPKKILNEKSETFAWAASFLPETDVMKLAALYAVCRKIDDLADEADQQDHPAQDLIELTNYLQDKKSLDQKVLLISGNKLHAGPLIDLIKGVQFDLTPVRISTQRELIEYCYRVAGTVGLMISELYSLPKSAEPQAISLGIGMQLTNIARDVHEDYKMNRIYIPNQWMDHRKLIKAIDSNSNRRQIISCLQKLLNIAQQFYRFADYGWKYLPWSIRPGLYFASVCYRSIGNSILKRQTDSLNQKPTLSFLTIASTLYYVIFEFLCRSFGQEQINKEDLRNQIRSARKSMKIKGSEIS